MHVDPLSVLYMLDVNVTNMYFPTPSFPLHVPLLPLLPSNNTPMYL